MQVDYGQGVFKDNSIKFYIFVSKLLPVLYVWNGLSIKEFGVDLNICISRFY